MKTKQPLIVGIILFLNFSVSPMVIHNYSSKKDKAIRTETGEFDEDYLFIGNELNFSGEAEDLVFLGKRLTFKGKTRLGLIALCRDLIYSGTSDNGIIAAAMDITADGSIRGNNYIACRNFLTSENSLINGNVFIGCARLSVDGRLDGNLYAGASELIINNEIKGDVSFKGRQIIFGDNGKIDGNLSYSTREKLSEKDLSKVSGKVTFERESKKELDQKRKPGKHAAGFLFGLALFISFVIVGSLLLFLPAFKRLDEKQSARSFWNTALLGLIPILIYPGIVVLCFALIVTIPFAFVLIFSFIPLFFIANIIGVTLLGKYLVSLLKWNLEKRHSQFIIGALVAALLSLIPFINLLSFLFVSALGWGVLISFLFRKNYLFSE